jgi:uncharacterized Zn finger protein
MRHPIDRRRLPRESIRCPACKSDKTKVTLRVTRALYLRCEDCGYLWAHDKRAVVV